MLHAPGKVIIACPTKTGSRSVHALCDTKASDTKFELLPPPKHTVYVPDDLEGDRLLMVRDPYKRFVSAYLYHKFAYREWWPVRIVRDMTLDQYAEWFAHTYDELMVKTDIWRTQGKHDFRWSPRIWMPSLTMLYEAMGANNHSEVAQLPNVLWMGYGIRVSEMPQRNMIKNHINFREIDTTLSPAALGIINEVWAKDDCARFGYALRTE